MGRRNSSPRHQGVAEGRHGQGLRKVLLLAFTNTTLAPDSYGFGWLGVLLLRLNLLKVVAARGAGKSLRRLVGHVVLGQGECPVLNLEDGEDHCADGIIRWWRRIFDGGV